MRRFARIVLMKKDYVKIVKNKERKMKMKKLIILLVVAAFILTTVLFSISCKTEAFEEAVEEVEEAVEEEIEEEIEEEEIETNDEKALVGFNVRWRNTPELSPKLLTYIDSLKPNLMRYPGGTIAHKWNWREGLPNAYNSKDYVHKIEDIKKVTEGTHK